MTAFWRVLVVGMLAMSFFTGCASEQAKSPTLAPTVVPTSAATVPVPTGTPTLTMVPSPTSTPLPTSTPPPTSTPLPTSSPEPTATPTPFIIQDAHFQEYNQECATDINITSVDGNSLGFSDNASITTIDGAYAIFCNGAKHTWIGTLTFAGYTFSSNEQVPLQFMVTPEGYKYISGIGSVTSPDGVTTNLGSSETAPALPGSLMVTGCASANECPDAVWITDLFGEKDTSAFNLEYSVTIPADTRVLFYFGWCAIDQTTLDENLSQMDYELLIDNASYLDNASWEYLTLPDDTDPSIVKSCHEMGVVVSNWQVGHTYRVVFGTLFYAQISDGWNTYPESIRLRTYLITISPAE